MKRVLVALPIAALLFMTMGASTAAFAAPVTHTLVVDDDGMAVAGNCDSSTATPYNNIPAAVTDAVSGDTILVCPGNYHDNQIVVNTPNLTIEGAYAGTSAQACVSRTVPGHGESRVFSSAGPGGGGSPTGAFWLRADNITIDGFLIEDNAGPGIQTDNTNSGYLIRNNLIRNNVMGLYLQANPSGTAIRTMVRYNCFQSNNSGAAAGNGSGILTDAGLRHATIFSNTFRHNENAGIFLFGQVTAGPAGRLKNVNVVSNTSIDDKTFLAITSGTGFYVQGNRVMNDCCSFGDEGSAIYIGGGSDGYPGNGSNAVVLVGNRIDSDNSSGIAIRGSADNIVANRNVISHTHFGISVSSDAPGAALVHLNQITDVSEIGLDVRAWTGPPPGQASENQISNNVVSGSGTVDCKDASSGPGTFGTANHWVNNTGATSSPAGLCAP